MSSGVPSHRKALEEGPEGLHCFWPHLHSHPCFLPTKGTYSPRLEWKNKLRQVVEQP